MKHVLIVQRRMPQYRVPLFDHLRSRMAEENLKLTVVYSRPTSKELFRRDEGILPWGTKATCHYLSFGPLELVFVRIPKELLKQQNLIILPHENRVILNSLQMLSFQNNGGRYAFFGHGAGFQSSQNIYREKLKAWMAKKADWYFAYTSISVDKIVEKGFPREKVTCLNNSADISNMIEWKKNIAPDEIYALRTALGIRGNNIIVFIGALTRERRFDFLFSSVDHLRKQISDLELVIIGDGPFRRKVQEYESRRPWVHWVGAKQGREKLLHLLLGKVVLNPGMVGLNLLDSFSSGLPMVTTDCGIHSPEIAYLKNGKNGFMTNNNQNDYIKCVVNLLNNPDLQKELEMNCIKDAATYSLDNMVDNFVGGIKKALNN